MPVPAWRWRRSPGCWRRRSTRSTRTWAQNFIIVVFAVVVIGGMGSILGSIVTGFGLGIVAEGLTKGVLSPGLGNGYLRRDGDRAAGPPRGPVWEGGLRCPKFCPNACQARPSFASQGFSRPQGIALLIMVVLLAVAPFEFYPVFLMKVLCFALFACAFNLLIGYVGLLSFGHAAYFGLRLVCGRLRRPSTWGLDAGTRRSCMGGLTGGGAGCRVRLARHPPPGHLFLDDHARPGADERTSSWPSRRRSPAWRGRHPAGAARRASCWA